MFLPTAILARFTLGYLDRLPPPSRLHQLFPGDLSAKLKPLCLKLLLTIIQASNNLNQNTLVQYLMLVDMFSSVISVL
ncbi:hypothetical protein Pelo_19784 [Pelomyxa schiedti]|nr:hypothetical protein Pelo_19784 [Pelomyxa schiedti]